MIINPILYQQGTKLPELENPGTAADLLAGKQLVDQYGNPLTGTMPTAAHPKPTISRSGGTVTAKHVQSAGYTEGGTTTETLTIPTKAGTTITPGTSRKTAVSSGYLTTGAVYVAGDANLVAGNIKSGVSIFGVVGSFGSERKIKLTVSNQTTSYIYFVFQSLKENDIQKNPGNIHIPAGEQTTYYIDGNSFAFIACNTQGRQAECTGCVEYTNYIMFGSVLLFKILDSSSSGTIIVK